MGGNDIALEQKIYLGSEGYIVGGEETVLGERLYCGRKVIVCGYFLRLLCLRMRLKCTGIVLEIGPGWSCCHTGFVGSPGQVHSCDLGFLLGLFECGFLELFL